MLTLADGLLLGSIGIIVSVVALYVILNCMSDSDSAEGLKEEELNVVERFWPMLRARAEADTMALRRRRRQRSPQEQEEAMGLPAVIGAVRVVRSAV